MFIAPLIIAKPDPCIKRLFLHDIQHLLVPAAAKETESHLPCPPMPLSASLWQLVPSGKHPDQGYASRHAA
jgi:hypothetical protein